MNYKALLMVALASFAGCSSLPAPRDRLAPSASIEVAFSPHGGATALVIQAVDAAKKEILVQAYGFTSRPIADALVRARQRGVVVRALLDKSQRTQRGSLGDFIAAEGLDVGIDARHAIAHNKVMVIDGETVLTGSFNFTASAESRNAENVLLLSSHPEVAARYRDNWQQHRAHSEAW